MKAIYKAVSLSVMLLLPSFAEAQSQDQEPATVQKVGNTFLYLKGEGTQQKPYLIDSYEALVEYRELVALECNLYYAKLTADIDLGADPNWAPIRHFDNGKSQKPFYNYDKEWFFSGEFDGQGHTISNLTINKRIDAVRTFNLEHPTYTDDVYLGLFGRANGRATSLKNLNLTNVKMNIGLEAGVPEGLDIYAGAFIGYSNGMMSDIRVDGQIEVTDESSADRYKERYVNVGGVIGKIIDDGEMAVISGQSQIPSNLHADIDITSNALGSNIGGIVGCVDKVNLNNCTSSGLLTVREVQPSVYASLWEIAAGGICGLAYLNGKDLKFYGLCSVARVEGGNWSGGLMGRISTISSTASSWATFNNSYAAGGISKAYNYSGGLVGAFTRDISTDVSTSLRFNSCYYAGTLSCLSSGQAKAIVGNPAKNTDYKKYSFVNCAFDKRMVIDDTDYLSMLDNIGTEENLEGHIFGYDTNDLIGTSPNFSKLVDQSGEWTWSFEEGLYPQLNAIKPTSVSSLAATPVFFRGTDHAERVYLGANLPDVSYEGEQGEWATALGNGSVANKRLLSDHVGYDILSLSVGTCAKRLNLYMAYSDEKWEGESHIPTCEPTDENKKTIVYYNDGRTGGNGTPRAPFVIMNAGQLAYAVKYNQQNEYYVLGRDITINRNLLSDLQTAIPWIDTRKKAYTWAAHLDGDNCVVHGMYLPDQSSTDPSHQHGLLGSIASTGSVANLGMAEAVITGNFQSVTSETYVGALAGSVASGATVNNCFASGYSRINGSRPYLFAGGICGQNSGSISNCLNAMTVLTTWTEGELPQQTGGLAGKANSGATFTDCINLGRVSLADYSESKMNGGICPGSGFTATDCYFDQQLTACATEEGRALTTAQMTDGTLMAGKAKWTVAKGHYPVLASFDNDYMKILAQPVSFYQSDCSASVSSILELPMGGLSWSKTDDAAGCVNLYADYGFVEPAAQGTAALTAMMKSADGRSKAYCPLFLTTASEFLSGIQFVDPRAEEACVAAFGAGGVVTLAQAIAATDFASFRAHEATPYIVSFPEMRYFSGITTLTNQLSSCSSLQEVELPMGLTSIASDAFQGCSQLQTVTLPVKLQTVQPYAFRNSQLKEILVHPDNSRFISREGVLFDADEYIVAYPPQREGDSYMYTDALHGIRSGAFIGIQQLEKLYIGDDWGTYIDLKPKAIPTTMKVYVNDATDNSDYIDAYRYDATREWQYIDDADNLQRYFPLKVTSARYATLCIYFDTELPQGVTAYYCKDLDKDEGKVNFTGIGRQVPSGLPVLIHGTPGIYPLLEYEGRIPNDYDVYDNYQGSGQDGFKVGDQSPTSGTTEGSILTLGRSSQGELGFFFYSNETNLIPPFRCYLVVETLGSRSFSLSFSEADAIDAPEIVEVDAAAAPVYDLMGRRVASDGSLRSLPKGIYIRNGKKIRVN